MIDVCREFYGTSLRAGQKHFLKYYQKHGESHNILAELPTGSGKSLIAMQIALNINKPGTVFIVTGTKILMKQYEKDFGKNDNILFFAGKAEYKCKKQKGNYTAQNCIHSTLPCQYHGTCDYTYRIQHFHEYDVVVTNYHMFLALIHFKNRHNIGWSSPLVIWDEGHKFHNILINMTSLEYNMTRMQKAVQYLEKEIYNNTDTVLERSNLAQEIYRYLNTSQKPQISFTKKIKNLINEYTISKRSEGDLVDIKEETKHKKYVKHVKNMLYYFNHIYYLEPEPFEQKYDDEIQQCIRLIPKDYTFISRFLYAPSAAKHLIITGTAYFPDTEKHERLKKTQRITGMPIQKIYTSPVQYHFNPQNITIKTPQNLKHIYYNNSREYQDFKKAYQPLVDLIQFYDVNTLIHFNAKWQCSHMTRLLKESQYNKPIYDFHENGNNTQTKTEIQEKFKHTGGILIGSSLHEGLNFPGKELELVIIGRTPYTPHHENNKYHPHTKNKIRSIHRVIWNLLTHENIIKDMESEEYRIHITQQIGRLQRTETDTGTIILCNSHLIHPTITQKYKNK